MLKNIELSIFYKQNVFQMFNLISLFSLLRTEDSAKEFLQQKGILKTETVCPKCKCPCVTEVKRKNFRFFKCSKCNVEESIRKGSFLYNKVGRGCFFNG